MIYQHERGEAAWKTYSGPPPKLPKPDFTLGDVARDYLLDRGLNPKLAGHNGWYPADMDVPRLVIPCINSEGRCYWQARAMDDKTKLRYDSPTAPRGDSVVAAFPFDNVKPKQRVILVEGPMDALLSASFGYVGIALMGNNPAPEALEFIAHAYGRIYAPFYVVPDKDDEGFGAKLVAMLAQHGVASRVVLVPGAKDLCELTPKQREKFFNSLKG